MSFIREPTFFDSSLHFHPVLLSQESELRDFQSFQSRSCLVVWGVKSYAPSGLFQSQSSHRTIAGGMQEKGILECEFASFRVCSVVTYLYFHRMNTIPAETADSLVPVPHHLLQDRLWNRPLFIVPEEAHMLPLHGLPI